ncbi:MAG: 3-oxoacyl-ACP synthase [Bacteroidetes bacterium RBG_13_42_15]|nr:MAG: 3-oxoacyl-ACP synthase [Bacteroidetes bacterium RBG_13_42_15]
MKKLRAAITGVGGYVPPDILDNEQLSRMVDTSDEWIMQRIGIKERRILKEKGKATSYMGTKAVKDLLKKTGTKPEEVDFLICGTITPDMPFPAVSQLICHKAGLENAFGYDIVAACSGFLYALETGRRFIETGACKKVIVVGADMMSSITDYEDRATCPLFGDGAGAVLLEPTTDNVGIIDAIMQVDGAGAKYLHMVAGGSLNPPSHETVDKKQHFVFQEGQAVFKVAVSKMADVSVDIMKRNNLNHDDIKYLVPHQANLRIIEATARRMGISREQVMINIEKYGNTTAATIPLCLWDFEHLLEKGDNLILTSFGAGYTWGSMYLKWAYNGKIVKR